jgi:hypothetical protein
MPDEHADGWRIPKEQIGTLFLSGGVTRRGVWGMGGPSGMSTPKRTRAFHKKKLGKDVVSLICANYWDNATQTNESQQCIIKKPRFTRVCTEFMAKRVFNRIAQHKATKGLCGVIPHHTVKRYATDHATAVRDLEKLNFNYSALSPKLHFPSGINKIYKNVNM